MRRILSNWKSARRRSSNTKVKGKVKGKGKQKRKHNLSNGTGKCLRVIVSYKCNVIEKF